RTPAVSLLHPSVFLCFSSGPPSVVHCSFYFEVVSPLLCLTREEKRESLYGQSEELTPFPGVTRMAPAHGWKLPVNFWKDIGLLHHIYIYMMCHPSYSGERCEFFTLPVERPQEGYNRTTALAVVAVVLSSICLTIIGLLLMLRFHKRGAYDVENEEKVKLGLASNH
uniref:Heparin-binding EGF-like growth factor a n=1 Tax=Hippocampus comes TaxID=109280 RepID=A0A3Q2XFT3_HIPCM